MKLIPLLTDVIAVRRLTRLVLEDRITEDIREYIFDRFPPQTTKIGFLFTCPWCVSIWAGTVIFGLRAVNPAAANLLSGLLASSEITGLAVEQGY